MNVFTFFVFLFLSKNQEPHIVNTCWLFFYIKSKTACKTFFESQNYVLEKHNLESTMCLIEKNFLLKRGQQTISSDSNMANIKQNIFLVQAFILSGHPFHPTQNFSK